jgi:putative sterol carrier protein
MSALSKSDRYMQAMAAGFQSAKAGGLRIVYQFQLTGAEGGTWGISIADGKCSVSQGAPPRADTTVTMSTAHYYELAEGKLDAVDAFNKGQIRVSGDLAYARKFVELFPPWASFVLPDAPPETTPTPPAPEPAPLEPTLADYVRAMPKGFRPDKAGGLRAVYHFRLTGDGGGDWTVTVADRNCTVAEGKVGSPSATIRMSGVDFVKLAQGALDTTRAYSQGKIKVSGDLGLATKIRDIFGPWADYVETTPRPEPAPSPTPEPKPTPTPEPSPTPPPAGPVNPTLLNGSFDDFQPFIRDGGAKVWKEPQFPERYGAHWTLVTVSEGESRMHLMDSETFGRFTQKYFGGGGLNYHVHGSHSQVITSRYQFDMVLMQTVAAQPGREYAFHGNCVSYFKGTDNPATHGKVFKTVGIDPTGGRDYSSPNVVWGDRDGRDHEWRHVTIQAKARANTITVFIRLENTERDVGTTELNIIHLDQFELES